MNVSENHGTVEAYTGWDAAMYRNTLTLPTRPSNDYYTLEDINISGMALQGEHLNILAAVKKVANGWESIVSWCFERGRPRRIALGLRETFTKRSIVERTNKAEIRPEEQSEKVKIHRRTYGMKYS